MLSKNAILSAHWPEELFPATDHRTTFIALAKDWHPDHNKDSQAGDVFSKINALYENLTNKLSIGGQWGKGDTELTPHGPVSFLRKTKTEDGIAYVGLDHVTFVLNDSYQPFEGFRFASSGMATEMRKSVPENYKWLDSHTLRVDKEVNYLSLRHIMDHGTIPVDHVAWIVSRLCSICCWLEWMGRAHNAIHTDNLFVNPITHSVFVVGGWWHNQTLGQPLRTLPRSSYTFLTQRQKPVATRMLDAECLRRVATELLGTQTCPKAMSDWLASVPHKSAIEDFLSWQAAKKNSFPRRFVEWHLNVRDIYGGFDGRR
jgi:hypothetical protein